MDSTFEFDAPQFVDFSRDVHSTEEYFSKLLDLIVPKSHY